MPGGTDLWRTSAGTIEPATRTAESSFLRMNTSAATRHHSWAGVHTVAVGQAPGDLSAAAVSGKVTVSAGQGCIGMVTEIIPVKPIIQTILSASLVNQSLLCNLQLWHSSSSSSTVVVVQ